jgi:hypothetical protein
VPRAYRLFFFLILALAAIAPLRNYDLFWHLATGRWIVEHRALPLHDPFALASEHVAWINGEWLFEIAAYALHALVGLAGLSIVRGVLLGGVFALATDGTPQSLLLSTIAFAGAMPLFDFRPASLAMLFVVLAIRARTPLAHALIALVWINVHPSALLAPLIALLLTRNAKTTLASAAALFVNPFGYRALLAPLSLASFASGGAFVNMEWLPSPPLVFPLLYVCIAIAVIVFATVEKRDYGQLALLAIFAVLAVRYVRNQPLFFAAFPPLVAPHLRRIPAKLAYAAAAAIVAMIALVTDHERGLMRGRFPVQAIARLQATPLRGNFYNADQFGGFLEWSFYPERRALIDGRNELYRTFIPEYARARQDQRAWNALLRRYHIDVAVDEYLPPLHVIEAGTGRTRDVPASLAYWPRRDWALVAYDGAAMVFARRAAFGAELSKWEIRGVVPDAPSRRDR